VKRVVADTNVLVSAIQFGGKPKQLLDLAVDGHIDLAISEAILEETLRVLRDKFHRTAEELRESDKQLRVVGRIVTPTEGINVIDADPSDAVGCPAGRSSSTILPSRTCVRTLVRAGVDLRRQEVGVPATDIRPSCKKWPAR
jgi:hypothetical protein